MISQVSGQELAEGDITLDQYIPKESLTELLETAAASERKGKNKFKRYPVHLQMRLLLREV